MRSFVLTVKISVMIGLAGVLLAGCSSSIDRFADYPGESDRTHTASTPRASGSAASDDYIESSSLGSTPVRSSGSNPYAASAPYKPPVYNQVQTYGQTPAYQPAQYQPQANYDEGGAVVVEPGQTLYSIARAHGMSVAQLAAVNGIHPPYSLHAGQRLRVPGSDEPRAEATYAPAQQNFSKTGRVHVVRSGETLFALGRRYGVHPYKIADFNGLSHDVSLSTGQKVRIPGGKSPERIASDESFDPPQQDTGSYEEEQDSDRMDREREDNNTDVTYAPSDEDSMGTRSETEEEDTQSAPPEEAVNNFRWPVKGRIISKYGSKPTGTRNEGINIAVPEGTSVRAAESGVVAYAGNELKGYGNLVLIRHDGGWVTAYAHNKQLFVKRGDTVRRGDVIAKAGQTGSVDAPQLHFELRKGATAVDPLKYLGSAQAAND